MPQQYDAVSSDRQLPKRRAAPASEKVPEVAITADIPADLRRQVTIACAVHGVKLKTAVAEALALWLKQYQD